MVVNFFLRISANSAASLPAPAPRYRKAGTFVSRRGEGREECAPDPRFGTPRCLFHAPLFHAPRCPVSHILGGAKEKQGGNKMAVLHP